MRSYLLVGLPPALLLVTTLCGADQLPPCSGRPDRAAAEIDELIRQLGDASFEVRQAATHRLMEREDAAPALRQALKSPDAEVARRAGLVLDALARREDRRALARLAGLAKNGAVDQAAELLVRRPTWGDDDAAWQVMTELADRLIDSGEKEFGKPAIPPRQDYLPAGDYRRYVAKGLSKVVAADRVTADELVPDEKRGVARFVVRAHEIEVDQVMGNLLVSAGTVRGTVKRGTDAGELRRCVIFANGPVEFMDAFDSVVVCDGDFTASNIAKGCLIVARGDVRCLDAAINCRIVASGKVHLPKYPRDRGTKVMENEPNPLGFVKFFDPASVGVTVEAAEGGVRVKETAEGKAFAKAGLRVGDLALASDGTEIPNPDAFRRLLRKKLATGGDLTLEVRRDGKPVKLVVPLKD